MHSSEIFECRNCLHAGPLTIHGRCEHCNSDAVISQEVIALLLIKNATIFPEDPLAIMQMGTA
jgi:hypothetical protein